MKKQTACAWGMSAPARGTRWLTQPSLLLLRSGPSSFLGGDQTVRLEGTELRVRVQTHLPHGRAPRPFAEAAPQPCHTLSTARLAQNSGGRKLALQCAGACRLQAQLSVPRGLPVAQGKGRRRTSWAAGVSSRAHFLLLS